MQMLMKDLPKRNTLWPALHIGAKCTWASYVSADEMKCITETAAPTHSEHAHSEHTHSRSTYTLGAHKLGAHAHTVVHLSSTLTPTVQYPFHLLSGARVSC